MLTEKILFWSAILLLGYAYLGYPIVIGAWGALRSRPFDRRHGEPSVTIVIVVHNEGLKIDRRLQNLMVLDYPRHRFEILVGSDGSTDASVACARAYEHAGVSVSVFERRRGKAAVLNDLVPNARGEIVVFTDARQRFDVGALRALVAPFADPQVGAVSGELILSEAGDATTVGQGVGAYWRYEKFIRASESRAASAVGATGAIYAIRQGLFEPIPEDTILDDVLIPLRIARRGYRVLFEPRARAYDRVAMLVREELTRKVRTLAGNFQLFARERWLLSPFHNPLWFQTLSHKGLRLVAPLLQLTALASNLFLLDEPVYRITLTAQLLFLAAALGGYALQRANRRSPLLVLPYTVCLLSWATVLGFVRFVTGRQRVTWEKSVS